MEKKKVVIKAPKPVSKIQIVTGEGGQFRPAGKAHTREHDVRKGKSRKPKHKKKPDEGV